MSNALLIVKGDKEPRLQGIDSTASSNNLSLINEEFFVIQQFSEL